MELKTTNNHERPMHLLFIYFLPPPSLHHQGHLILFVGVHLRLGEEVSKTVVLNDLVPGDDE
jgi:hypothetical protein